MTVNKQELLAALGELISQREDAPQIRVTTLEALRDSEDFKLRIAPNIYEMAKSVDFASESASVLALKRYCIKAFEAEAETAFGQLLRAEAQTYANDWYTQFPVTYPGYVMETTSNKRQEFIPPLSPLAFPRKANAQTPFKVQHPKGLDRELINYKYMGGVEFESELVEDDQTGQIKNYFRHLGESFRRFEEALVAGRAVGAAFTVGFGEDVESYDASSFSDTNAVGTAITTPFSANLYSTAVGNIPGSYAALNTTTLEAAEVALGNALTKSGVRLGVTPDTLLVGTANAVNIRKLLHSRFMPTISSTAGDVAQIASANPYSAELMVLKPFVNRYFPLNKAWILMEGKKGLVFQSRTAMEIVQEVPQAGRSYDYDILRWRSRRRLEIDWVDSRFAYMGNNGSV